MPSTPRAVLMANLVILRPAPGAGLGRSVAASSRGLLGPPVLVFARWSWSDHLHREVIFVGEGISGMVHG